MEATDMGVLSCDRQGCNSIMCDRYSYSFGYICANCYTAAVKLRITDEGRLSDFMDDGDMLTPDDEEAARKFLDDLFPLDRS
jgi:hypothetical protein